MKKEKKENKNEKREKKRKNEKGKENRKKEKGKGKRKEKSSGGWIAALNRTWARRGGNQQATLRHFGNAEELRGLCFASPTESDSVGLP